MARPSNDATVNVEMLKLLLQAAWADGVLDEKERSAVSMLCRQWAIDAETTTMLLHHLQLGTPLPQPNLGLLREHRESVLAAARWFVGVDGVVDEAEKDFVDTVAQLLS